MYDEKNTKYFGNVRKELLSLIPEENRNGDLLEIGAGNGNTLLYAQENGYAKNIYGIELFEIEDSNQNSDLFSDFVIGDIEKIPFPFQKSKFDVILLGDVLEHLIDPYTTLKNLKQYLKDDGVIVASIPNIREWNTMKSIFFKGDFKYEESGILDKTHLRFFAKKNIIDLFEDNDFNILKIIGSNRKFVQKYIRRLQFFRLLMLLIFDEFMNTQYFVVANKHNKID